jgi:hypothetical protein
MGNAVTLFLFLVFMAYSRVNLALPLIHVYLGAIAITSVTLKWG